jgi:hypothetical protein
MFTTGPAVVQVHIGGVAGGPAVRAGFSAVPEICEVCFEGSVLLPPETLGYWESSLLLVQGPCYSRRKPLATGRVYKPIGNKPCNGSGVHWGRKNVHRNRKMYIGTARGYARMIPGCPFFAPGCAGKGKMYVGQKPYVGTLNKK